MTGVAVEIPQDEVVDYHTLELGTPVSGTSRVAEYHAYVDEHAEVLVESKRAPGLKIPLGMMVNMCPVEVTEDNVDLFFPEVEGMVARSGTELENADETEELKTEDEEKETEADQEEHTIGEVEEKQPNILLTPENPGAGQIENTQVILQTKISQTHNLGPENPSETDYSSAGYVQPTESVIATSSKNVHPPVPHAVIAGTTVAPTNNPSSTNSYIEIGNLNIVTELPSINKQATEIQVIPVATTSVVREVTNPQDLMAPELSYKDGIEKGNDLSRTNSKFAGKTGAEQPVEIITTPTTENDLSELSGEPIETLENTTEINAQSPEIEIPRTEIYDAKFMLDIEVENTTTASDFLEISEWTEDEESDVFTQTYTLNLSQLELEHFAVPAHYEIAVSSNELSAPLDEVETTLVELSGKIDELKAEESLAIHRLLDDIMLRAESTKNIADDEMEIEIIEEDLKELFTNLFNRLKIKYNPEIIESYVILALMGDLPKIIPAAETENSQETFKDKGTHEAIKQLLMTVSALKKAIIHAYQIGKSTMRLYAQQLVTA